MTARGFGSVLDIGIQPDHPLVGDLSAAHAVVAGPDGRPGVIRSLAPECELTSLRVLGAESSCMGEALLTGLGRAGRSTRGFDIVNVSLPTTKTGLRDALHDLADRAYFGGTMLVTAAGNRRILSTPDHRSSSLPVARTPLPLGRAAAPEYARATASRRPT